MSILTEGLPEWSRTGSPNYHADYSGLAKLGMEFLALPLEVRESEVEMYSKQYCFPNTDLIKASGLYVFLRIVFELPSTLPREKAKVFGSWMHPSIGVDSPVFDLSWPVTVEPREHALLIDRYIGYAGRPYKAFDEYQYFLRNFPFRKSEILQEFVVRQQTSRSVAPK